MGVSDQDLLRQLQEGSRALGLELGPGVVDRLIGYLNLLVKWNRTYNLTAVRDPVEMVSKHLLDSLAILPWVRGPRVLDVGTGPGLPGLPLAIARPDWQVALLDSNRKKTGFLVQAAATLGLENVEIIRERVEQFRPPKKFDTLTSRAFATLAEFTAASAHLLTDNGRWLAMKGVYPEDEIAALPETVAVVEAKALQVPGVRGERHIVVMQARQVSRPHTREMVES